VLKLVWEAGGENKSCIIFAILVCRKYAHHALHLIGFRYFKRKSFKELADAELYDLRVVTCDRMAKLIIDSIDDEHYLYTDILLKRFHHD
jgi:hypothetical protein